MNADASPFVHRGVVEGFYGTPYDITTRKWWIERLAALGMNRYVVAPKDDPLHRARWSERYDPETLAGFASLVAHGRAHGVDVGFGVSPGLSICASDPDDIDALLTKYRDFHAAGARLFVLALDDVPSELAHALDRRAFPTLAAAHLSLAHTVHGAFPDCTLWLVPNDYTGDGATDYLAELGTLLAPEIEVAWTGRSTLAPTIHAAEAERRAAVLGRKLLLWDNVPVADGPMRRMLHLGRYLGRSPQLPEHTSGILLNPMALAHSSWVTVACAAAYLSDPSGFDPERSWHDAVRQLGRGAEDAFRLFASAHRFSPQDPDPGDSELAAAIEGLKDGIEAGVGIQEAAAVLHEALTERRAVATALDTLEDRALAAEIAPWVAGHHEENRRMDAAAQALLTVFDDAATSMERCSAYSVFEGSLTLHPPATTVSYGPRRVFYPQLVSHREHDASLGPEPALFTACNRSDQVVALASEACLPRLGGVARSGATASAQRDQKR